MTWLYLNDTVLQKRNTFFVINSTAEIRQDTLSYTLTLYTLFMLIIQILVHLIRSLKLRRLSALLQSVGSASY